MIVIDKLAKFILTVAALVLAAGAGAAEPFPSGPPQADVIKFQLAVYYSAAPTTDPLAALRTSAQRDWPALSIVEQLPKAPTGMLLQRRMEMNVRIKYPPPDIESLGYFGRGLNRAQAAALQGSTQALQLNFSHPKQFTMEGLRTAYNVAEQVARQTGGLLWDEETREMFTPEKWHELRLANWSGAIPEVSKNINIHAYKRAGLIRAITLGMAKFGLPDIVIDQFPWTSNGSMESIITQLAQTMAEGATIGLDGHVDLDISAIVSKKMREPRLAVAPTKAQSVANLALVKGTPEDGDPANRLAEITFSRYPGRDALARQDAMLSAMFGNSNRVKAIRHNAELLAASQRAQMKLASLQAAFARGLQPGEQIEVKAPFARPTGGNEMMWVQVSSWKDGKIAGMLKNEPAAIPSMHAGQAVQVNQDKVFDYLRRYPDGRQEGDSTGKIIEKMNAAQ
jgi:uncharacterized protein YegJ (DUF2314 family)